MDSLEKMATNLSLQLDQSGAFCPEGELIDTNPLDEVLGGHFAKVILVSIKDWSVLYANTTFASAIGKSPGRMSLNDQLDIRLSFDAIGSMQLLDVYNRYTEGEDRPLSGLSSIIDTGGNLIQHDAASALVTKDEAGNATHFLQVFASAEERKLVNFDANFAVDQLTGRQRQVTYELLRGNTYAEISCVLGISVKTLEKHALVIYRHTGCQNQAELIHRCQ